MTDPADNVIVDTPWYTGQERRRNPVRLTDSQINEIAEKAAERAVERMTQNAYMAVGKTVLNFAAKACVIVGIVVTGLYVFLKSRGLTD